MISRQLTLSSLLKFTSSRGLEDGPSPANGQKFHKKSGSSPAPHLASLSPNQAREQGLMTTDTCGPHCTGTLSTANLTLLLESRSFHLLPLSGGIKWHSIWREVVTPHGRSLYQLHLSVPTNADIESIGAGSLRLWPAPTSLAMCKGRLAGESDGLRRLRFLANGRTSSGKPGGTVTFDPLNASFPRWLMGIPQVWDLAGINAQKQLDYKE